MTQLAKVLGAVLGGHADLSLQPRGSLAKAYQVRQARNVIIKYRLGIRDVPQV